MQLMDLLDRRFYGASVTRWLIALALAFASYLILSLTRRWVLSRLGKVAERTATQWDDLLVELIRRTRQFFLIVIALEAASRALPLNRGALAVLRGALLVAALLQLGLWSNGIISFLAERYARLKTGGDVASRATVLAIGYLARLAMWAILLVTALDFFDIRVRALLTTLGIGGIAVALAAQNILGDLFAALAIVLDRPFVVGDAVELGDVEGDIEQIGLKTTRIRSVRGELIVVSNSDMMKSRIRNFGRMRERRVLFHLDLAYTTPPDVVAKVPEMVKAIVEQQSHTRFGRCHFLAFTESALRLEAVYHVLDRDYKRFADIQQTVNLEILRRFVAEKIEFAVPARTLIIKGDAGRVTGKTS